MWWFAKRLMKKPNVLLAMGLVSMIQRIALNVGRVMAQEKDTMSKGIFAIWAFVVLNMTLFIALGYAAVGRGI